MPPIDLTSSFQSVFSEKLSSVPPSIRSKSPSRISTSRKGKGKQADHEDEEEFLKEAYRIYNHLQSLEYLLITVRKAYLSNVEPPPLSRRNHRLQPDSAERDKEEDEWKRWEKVKYLTDKERDEIDLRARMILRRCKDRVNVMEAAELARKSKNPSISSTKSAVLSFLPSLLPNESSSTSFQPLITAHRASVIWKLNDWLAKLTSNVSNLQEERFKRKEERMKSLGSNASIEASRLNSTINTTNYTNNRSKVNIPDGRIINVDDPAYSSSGVDDNHPGSGIGIIGPDANQPQLSEKQIQEYENENNILLENMSSTLSSVLSAESSLLEISQLQNELIQHLNSQTEMIDQLYEDAIGSVNEVGKANEQLKQARKRGQESRLFLLIFLMGASFALLFLDWYAA
ncbi:uncharacterized protein I303_106621 [Kwoniella dejecticola CBS 10117]|uniref:Syntaxin 18 n=1 Tax=Kwoniella dejecticola CBS 10117 TaxID=1296121 RepID=A0A1A5ZU78_9TREE|nr:syntaxin 18 [Kwoniella dejecticola CBS 10117]OBR81350.1 syntaxin 18 [Kwoniella dejecticola CBS 10117]